MNGTLDIQFRKNKLEKAYRNTKDGVRQLGADIHRKYVQRIDLICEARNIDELAMLPGLHWHSLKGGRAGQFAVTLTGNFRLILTVVEDLSNTVCVEEVIDYHGG